MATSRTRSQHKSATNLHTTNTLSSRIARLSSRHKDVLKRLVREYEEVDAKAQAANEQAEQTAAQIDETIQQAESHSRRELLGDHQVLNAVAYKAAPFELIEHLIQRWYPDIAWTRVHHALESIDDSGTGYWTFLDAFRDAAFLAGVCYGQRQLPSWLETFDKLSEESQEAVGQLVDAAYQRQLQWGPDAAAITKR